MKRKKVIIISVVAVVIVVVAVLLLKGSGEKEIRFNTATVREETVEIIVTATGYVQPVDQVEVGTQVSGVIERIYVDYNSQVKKGQLLAEVDKLTLNERVTQAEASLSSAQSDLTYSQQNYNREKQLYDAKAATEAAYEEAVNRLTQAQTSLVNAQANLHQAKVNLAYAEIYSPIDGVVLDRSVEEGQTVAASFSTPTLFTIANDLKNMQVEANVDEADIGLVRTGQKVVFTVDAYSDDTFEGSVNQIRLQPTVTNNVVTYTVIINAPNPEEKLFPGMTASVTIITKSEKGMAIPAEALSFNPSPNILLKLNIQPEIPVFQGQAPMSNPAQKAVWLQTSTGIVRQELKTGLSDGINTIVKEGLNIGDTIILSAFTDMNQFGAVQPSNSFMPRPPQRR